jgi:hypothetical protein
MEVSSFKCLVDVLSPTTAKTIIVAQIDPKVPLPKQLVNFVMKNVAGVLLHMFQRQAAAVAKDPECKHAVKIRQNRSFYEEWLLPKIREHCDRKGWEQPTVLSLR